uniref:G-protein coupled receptors family 1 profile domain-containing protein n=1 Tax=Ditylenchus dipsaci TaxID=166011 RepID=A0A915D2B0_9BILA
MSIQIPTSMLTFPTIDPLEEGLDLKRLTEKVMASPMVFHSLLKDHPELANSIAMNLHQLHSNNMNSSVEDECLHFVVKDPDPTNSPQAMSIFAFIYLNIFVLGLVGNLFIICLTYRHRHLQTVQNIFILNLAISDVIVCLLSLPFTPVTNVYKNWLFGKPICHLLPMVQAVSVFVSTFSLSAIAIDRYNLVVRPYAHPIRVQGATVLAIISWVLSVVVSLPYAYYMILEQYPGYCGQFCSEHWPNQVVRRGYALMVLTLQFLVPFMTMSFCYATIFSRLRQRANVKLKKLSERSQMIKRGIEETETKNQEVDASATTSLCRLYSFHRIASRTRSQPLANKVDNQQRLNVIAAQRRTTTILASMVIIFGLTWLPQNVVTLIIEYDDSFLQFGSTNYTYLLSMITHRSVSLNHTKDIQVMQS